MAFNEKPLRECSYIEMFSELQRRIERAEQLRDDARAMCERRTAERDKAIAVLNVMRNERHDCGRQLWEGATVTEALRRIRETS